MEEHTTDHQPATKGDIRELSNELERKLASKDELKKLGEGLRRDLASKDELKRMETGLRGEMQAMEKRIVHEFKTVAENIHKDVAGANVDRISGLETTQGDHEERITTLEKRVGLRVE